MEFNQAEERLITSGELSSVLLSVVLNKCTLAILQRSIWHMANIVHWSGPQLRVKLRREWPRGNAFWPRSFHTYTYAYVHTANIEMTLPRTTKIFSPWNVSVPPSNNFMWMSILKKSSILNFENPLFLMALESSKYATINTLLNWRKSTESKYQQSYELTLTRISFSTTILLIVQ